MRDIGSLEQLVIFFPENFKAELLKALLVQLTEILLNLKTIKLSTLMNLLDEKIKNDLNAKGIEGWNYSIARLELPD